MRINLPFGVFIFLCNFLEHTTAQQDVWFVPDNTSITGCSWHHDGAKVTCGPDFPLLCFGSCMTYNNKTGATKHGACPYIARYNTTHIDGNFYIQLPSNVSSLNEFMCGPLNREGPLCGKCKKGYGIAVYSYALE